MTRVRIALLTIGLLTTMTADAAGQVCMKTGERQEGANKVCVYQCRMTQAKVTVRADQPCPSTIKK